MLKLKSCLIPGLLLAMTGGSLTVTAPPAFADCNSSGGVTVCAQGTVDGPSGQPGPSGPYYPYPCDDDWLCDDGGVSIAVDPGPPRPPVDIGRPGRPGRPG